MINKDFFEKQSRYRCVDVLSTSDFPFFSARKSIYYKELQRKLDQSVAITALDMLGKGYKVLKLYNPLTKALIKSWKKIQQHTE